MTAARDLRYGQVLHYLWGGDDTVHSSVMFIMPTKDHRLMLMPLADSHMNTPVLVPILMPGDEAYTRWRTTNVRPQKPFG